MKAHAIAVAARAATEAHWGQTRKDTTTPSIVHPERVAACVGRCGGDHVGMIAAWLHDVIEDCADGDLVVVRTLQKTDLPEEDRVAVYAIVTAMTKNPAIPDKGERLMDSARRITQAPPQAILVKLCDRTDNVNDSRNETTEFVTEYLRLTDRLIGALSEGAISHGYSDAHERLKSAQAEAGRAIEGRGP
ncbi:MAG: bifunctional (p)ppGpp synthetase II/ guanosine-3',5'-bis pyrophosphate 3'-pyrophosphohydrolase [Euryarchaeota archaeon ADurb.BinA087]|nr:MAG: bifunctional (p)ppGpp synthetase II/ guanosine-3',5'-bis pyrophosphate 3'-pyrophosphohydrolase [Euryarchaeota archaeon ADurb.BinA087]